MCRVQEWDDESDKEKRIPKLPAYDFWHKMMETLHNVRSGCILLTCYPSNGGRACEHNHVSDDVTRNITLYFPITRHMCNQNQELLNPTWQILLAEVVQDIC
jgi:hypothetical protein